MFAAIQAVTASNPAAQNRLIPIIHCLQRYFTMKSQWINFKQLLDFQGYLLLFSQLNLNITLHKDTKPPTAVRTLRNNAGQEKDNKYSINTGQNINTTS